MHHRRQAGILGILALLVVTTGCSVRVNKNEDGKDKDVSIHTPFGGLQVRKDQHGGVDTGLPVYPGASLEASGGDDEKSVDLHMGFGPWQMRVQVANYTTGDPQEKVQAFYRSALARYGDVLTCRGESTVGTPTRTHEGLTCKDDEKTRNVHTSDDASLELKAGSERKQHIVAFDDKQAPRTHFTLIALTLPPKDKDHSSDSEE